MFKRGLSHLEFVISFIIFIAFLVSAFVFFNPLQSNRTLKSTMDYAWIEISKETKKEVDTYSILLDQRVTAPVVGISIEGINVGYNASVKDSSGNVINSYTQNGVVYFDRPADRFVRIEYSKGFRNGAVKSGGQISSGDFYVSSSENSEIYFQDLFENLKDEYYANYTQLKRRLNLPSRVEFGFKVVFNNGTEISALKEIPSSLEVLSRSDKVGVILSSGEKQSADLLVMVW